MDDRHTEWDTATLFIRSDKGIIYGDSIVDNVHLKRRKDALELSSQALDGLSKNPDNIIEAHIPPKAPKEMTGLSYKASVSVAKQKNFFMQEQSLEILLSQVKDVI